MTTVHRRLGVLLIALAVLMPLLQKSRAVSPREQAAFLRYTAGASLVKIAGAGQGDGVYRFSDSASLAGVIKLTDISFVTGSGIREDSGRKLKNGDMIVLSGTGCNNSAIFLKKMTVAERISLGIPLDPDTMSVGDWEALPGIGPALAKTIVLERQKNGDFHSLEGVLRVTGVGPGKLKTVKQYFGNM